MLDDAGVTEEVPAAQSRNRQMESPSRSLRTVVAPWRWVALGVGTIACAMLLWISLPRTHQSVAARSVAAAQPIESSPVQPPESEILKTIQAEQPPSGSESGMLALLPNGLSGATAEQQATAARLMAFSRDGDLKELESVSATDVEALAALLLGSLGAEQVNSALENGLNLPPGYLEAHPQPARAIADLYEAVKGTGDPSSARSLVFTDRCEDDGSVSGNVHVIPSGARRVYAAFENAGGLHGLDRVFAVWRNPADAKMVFAEYEPVHAGTAFNYVWLDLNDGWPAGHYELALYHPQRTTELLAARSFNVR